MTSENPKGPNTPGAAAVACTDLLADRIGFEWITCPFEQRRIRDEMRRLRADRDASQLGLSAEESDRLYVYMTNRRPKWQRGLCWLGDGKPPWYLPMKARITWLLDTLYSRLYRNVCIGWIRCLRFADRKS